MVHCLGWSIDSMLTLLCSHVLTGCSLCTCSDSAIIGMHHFPFSPRWSTPKPISRWTTSPSCVGTSASLPQPPRRPSLPHCPPDGRGTDPSLLVRSVTSAAHLGVARGASGRVRAIPRARDRGHVSCCTSNVPQMLLICRLMYFGESCVRALVSEASQPSN